MGILSGYRVLDCSIAMAGPFAAQRLGDLGADVVKVEPVTGEWQRHVAAGGARGNKHQRLVPVAEPQQALARDRPEIARRQGRAARSGQDRRRVPAELSAGRREAPRRRLRDAVEDQSAPRLCVDVRLWRGRSLCEPPRAGPGAAGHVGRDAFRRPRGRSRRRRRASIWSMRSPPTTPSRARLPRCCTASGPARGSWSRSTCWTPSPPSRCRSSRSSPSPDKPQARSAEPHAHVYIRAPYGAFATSDGYIIIAFPKLQHSAS